MRSSILRSVKTLAKPTAARGYASESVTDRKVAVLGAAGGIGQPLALLMKLNPLVSRLALYDIANTPGVAADVSHINTKSEECGEKGGEESGTDLKSRGLCLVPVACTVHVANSNGADFWSPAMGE